MIAIHLVSYVAPSASTSASANQYAAPPVQSSASFPPSAAGGESGAASSTAEATRTKSHESMLIITNGDDEEEAEDLERSFAEYQKTFNATFAGSVDFARGAGESVWTEALVNLEELTLISICVTLATCSCHPPLLKD